MSDDLVWQTKVAARLHDPAEKALVLLRDPAGHENGTSRALTRLLGFHDLGDDYDPENDEALVRTLFHKGIPRHIYQHIQRADWWASAADRPQFPMQEITIDDKAGNTRTLAVAPWAQVRWFKEPLLTHPLSGTQVNLNQHGGLADSDINDIKTRSFNHAADLIMALNPQNTGKPDWKKRLLTFWRFGPELNEEEDNGQLGALWQMLPADTRIPDHSIWDHLDLTSAFAGAFAGDPDNNMALLALSIGPVQPFIAAARKMEDLWAGSHLLSRLAWEAMRVICDELGPDAILFPRLRGIPQVDIWLRDECGLPSSFFDNCDWNQGSTDSNPLFSAALPNRFVAAVPASRARDLAEKVQSAVHKKLQSIGQDAVMLLLKEAGFDTEGEPLPYEQMQEQLSGFPEVHWAAVPFSLIKTGNAARQTDLNTTELSEAMAPFFAGSDAQPGFLGTPAWQLLQQHIQLKNDAGDKATFFAPNPGVLYPAVYDLAERVLAAAKSTRPFRQQHHEGWRCTLTGATEWLTTQREQLHWTQQQRQQRGTLWTALAEMRPSLAKPGEHLGALPALKRAWPTLFAEEAGRALTPADTAETLVEHRRRLGRFVVSTHSMALAHQMSEWLKRDEPLPDSLANALQSVEGRAALPRKLAKRAFHHPQGDLLAKLPLWLDRQRESDNADALQQAEKQIRNVFGNKMETYYGLLMLDGDKMGQLLSGEAANTPRYLDSFHPKVREGFTAQMARHPQLKAYGEQPRALSPNRHLAISAALNDYSLRVVRHVVEEEHLGRLVYAGGDDVFAMLPVADLLPAMQRLRYAWSGHDPTNHGDYDKPGLSLHNGFARLGGRHPRFMRMMGTHATASCGAIIAHHQAPLTAVRRELDAAEQRAKHQGGRNAFSLVVIKRSGSSVSFTDHWGEPINLLIAVRDFLASPGVSRRAVFNTLQWLDARRLPAGSDNTLLQSLLSYQLARQADSPDTRQVAQQLATRLAAITDSWPQNERIERLRNLLGVAEFLARETRLDHQSSRAVSTSDDQRGTA